MLRGCAMLRVAPDSDWFLEFFSQSQPQLRTASGPQLANLGWALAQLRCVPPRQWTHEWVLQLRKRLHGGGRPLGAAKAKWHGIGYAVHAKRAVAAVAAFRPSELQEWCQWLRTPMPRQRPAPARSPAPALAATEVDGGEGAPLAASAALATSAVAIMAQGEQGDEQDFLDGARPQDDSDEEDPART